MSSVISFLSFLYIQVYLFAYLVVHLLCPQLMRGVGGYIVFGADPVCVGVGVWRHIFFSAQYLVNHCLGSYQICKDTSIYM